MDKDLLVDGKSYISAVRASKKIGYASDYIGQLCRAGKVPGKLLGRSWYVDFDALQAHKKGNKTRKNKGIREFTSRPVREEKTKVAKEKVFENYFAEAEKHFDKKVVSIPKVAPSVAGISYAPIYKSRLPEIKKVPQAAVLPPIRRSKNSLVTLGLVMFMLLSVYAAGYIRYATTSHSGSQASLGASSFLSSIFDKIFGRNEKTQLAPKSNDAQFGIVALPENDGDHASIVAKVKKAFSDEVDVIVDPEGDAGVIRPVFRDGDATEDYAFVMVPIRDSQQTTNN